MKQSKFIKAIQDCKNPWIWRNVYIIKESAINYYAKHVDTSWGIAEEYRTNGGEQIWNDWNSDIYIISWE